MTIAELFPQPRAQAPLLRLYPRNPEPTLRVNFVASLDGAVTLDGKSGGLGGPGDKLIFDTLRMVCDALVVASGTVQTENYDALRLTEPARQWRREQGLSEFPLMVIVSGSLALNLDQLVFTDAPIRPVVVTHSGAAAERRQAVGQVADLIVTDGDEVDLAAALAELRERGASQILCEGGPHLFGALTAADLVDELCLTVSPVLAGAGPGRITAGNPGPSRSMSLLSVCSAESMLFLRYARKVHDRESVA